MKTRTCGQVRVRGLAGAQAACKDSRTASGWGLATGVRSPCFFACGLGLENRSYLFAGHAESFSQFGFWERDLVEARSRVSGVARSTPSSCPGQGNGVIRSVFVGRNSRPFSQVALIGCILQILIHFCKMTSQPDLDPQPGTPQTEVNSLLCS